LPPAARASMPSSTSGRRRGDETRGPHRSGLPHRLHPPPVPHPRPR
jgi:hypothetical protein